ncbi:unnamed protein product [Paramecium octaurelia]|uniref:Uncharacterized protein n=1 Tax=Paramecium octaurelia TaxID=43137 RepID=A0A8S1SUF4_PAROT|nr:unnamed protein product [Paramecium octaurelia]
MDSQKPNIQHILVETIQTLNYNLLKHSATILSLITFKHKTIIYYDTLIDFYFQFQIKLRLFNCASNFKRSKILKVSQRNTVLFY